MALVLKHQRSRSASALLPTRRTTRVDLSHSNLYRFPSYPAATLRELTVLDLSWNNLQLLPESVIGQLSQLRELYLSNNLISTVRPLLLLGTLPRLIELDLHGNPLPFSGPDAYAQLLRALLLLAPSAASLDVETGGTASSASLVDRPQTAQQQVGRPSSRIKHSPAPPTWRLALLGDASEPACSDAMSAEAPFDGDFWEQAGPRRVVLAFPRLRVLSGRPVTSAERKARADEREELETAGMLRGARERVLGRREGKPRTRRGFWPPAAEPWRQRLLERHETRTRDRMLAMAEQEEDWLQRRLSALFVYGSLDAENQEEEERDMLRRAAPGASLSRSNVPTPTAKLIPASFQSPKMMAAASAPDTAKAASCTAALVDACTTHVPSAAVVADGFDPLAAEATDLQAPAAPPLAAADPVAALQLERTAEGGWGAPTRDQRSDPLKTSHPYPDQHHDTESELANSSLTSSTVDPPEGSEVNSGINLTERLRRRYPTLLPGLGSRPPFDDAPQGPSDPIRLPSDPMNPR